MSRRSGAGYALFNLNNLEYLKRVVSFVHWRGFLTKQPKRVGYGGGGYARHGRLIIGGDGGGGGSSSADEGWQSVFSEGFGSAHVGLVLIDTAWLKLYPLVGGGAAGQGFAAHPATPGDADVLGGAYGALLLLGLGIELRLPLSRHFRPLIGLRVGCRWTLAERTFGSLELPPRKRGEPFLRLILGLGIER